MVAQQATAPVSAAPCSEQNNRAESTTLEPTPATCAGCESVESLYIIGGGFLCEGCIAATVSIACDIWPTDITYTRAFEKYLL